MSNKSIQKNARAAVFSCIVTMLRIGISIAAIVIIMSCNDSNLDSNSQDEAKIEDMSVLLIDDRADVDGLLRTLNATLVNTLQFDNKKYIVVAGMNRSIEEAQALEEVYFAEPNYERHIFEVPNDTYYSSQYAPRLTGLENVWDSNYTGAGVTVAVIDTGVNTLHEDFEGKASFVEGFDYDKNSAYTTTTHNDEHGHGTHVAGIIAARKNNNKGIAGIAPDAIIMPIRASESGNSASFSSINIAAAIKLAADRGADVINLSLGAPSSSYIEMEAINYALEKNISIVAAAGNDYLSLKNYPASFLGVIAVASSNGRDEVSSYSTRNSSISVAGQGENILSLDAGPKGTRSSSYVTHDGTSMASPYVAGVVALIKQKFPAARPAQIKQILESTAKDIDVAGKDIASGHGRVQAEEALAVPSLPDIHWTTLSIILKIQYTDGVIKNLVGIPVTIIDSEKNIIASVMTVQGGIAKAYLPDGTYTYTAGTDKTSSKGTATLSGTPVEKVLTLVK